MQKFPELERGKSHFLFLFSKVKIAKELPEKHS